MTKENIINMKKTNPEMSYSKIAENLKISKSYVGKVLKKNKDWDITELFISDIHIPYHNQQSIETVYRYTEKLKPNIIFLGGDIIDFHTISFWNKNPTAFSVVEEIKQTKLFLKELRHRYPTQKIYYLEGNHEMRLKCYISTRAYELFGLEQLELPQLLDFQEYNIKYIPSIDYIQNNGMPFKIGNLYHLHGHEIRMSFRAVSLARNAYLNLLDNCILSHFHRSDEWMQKTINNKIQFCYVMGCLCNLEAEYMPINNWNHGFGIIRYNRYGNFLVENKKIINNLVI